MKKRVFWKILTMALVLGAALALVACGNDNGGGGGNAFIGPELNLSGRVYEEEWLEAAPWLRFTRFTGDLQVTGYPVGAGSITGGNLSFTAGSPPASALREWCSCGWPDCDGGDCYDGWTDDQGRPIIFPISPADVRRVRLELRSANGSQLRLGNIKYDFTENQDGTSFTEIEDWEWVDFIYVDRDATWTSRGHTYTSTWERDGNTSTRTWTINAFTINLRQGWNAIHSRETSTEIVTETATGWAEIDTENEIISAGNPGNLRWSGSNFPAAIESLEVEVERPDRARGSHVQGALTAQ